jgi:hypothetical protein
MLRNGTTGYIRLPYTDAQLRREFVLELRQFDDELLAHAHEKVGLIALAVLAEQRRIVNLSVRIVFQQCR